MKQKIVIKVHMTCDKCRKKALGIAASAHGVQSMGIEGEYKDQLVVVGEFVDAINLTSCLRRKVGSAEIVTVEPVVAEETKPTNNAEGEGGGGAVAVWPQPQQQQWYPYAGYCYDDYCSQDSWRCTIM